MAYLEIENLSKVFKGNKVLDSFSLSLEKGKTLCLIGDSGSGKTTLLRMLNSLSSIDEGRIILEGKEISSKDKKNLRHIEDFSLVFQSYHLFCQYNVMENILLPLKTKIKRDLKAKKYSRKEFQLEYNKTIEEKTREVNDLLLEVHLQDKKDSYPHQLSGGEAQRVAILRALMLNPKVLCFDEPTSALDPRLKRQMANTILSLKKKGHTIILVTHEMELARIIADEVIFLKKGKIIEKGSKEILTNPRSEELKTFLSLEHHEDSSYGQNADPETARAYGTLFSLSQD